MSTASALFVVLLTLPEPLTDPPKAPPIDITRYWAEQPIRGFLSGHVAVGGLNRLMVAAGYGRPHWTWMGVQLEVLTTPEFFAFYGGVELELLLVNIALGFRQTYSYGKNMPVVAPTYSTDDVYKNPSQPRQTYQSLDFGLWGFVPVRESLAFWEFAGSWLPFKSPDVAVFDEYLRFTFSGEFGARGRVLWGLRLWDRRITVGPMAELVGSTGRPLMVRLGGGFLFTLTRHLMIKLNVAVPVTSPDPMGWVTQSVGEARLIWSWATGETQWGFR